MSTDSTAALRAVMADMGAKLTALSAVPAGDTHEFENYEAPAEPTFADRATRRSEDAMLYERAYNDGFAAARRTQEGR